MRKALLAVAIILGSTLTSAIAPTPAHAVSYFTCDANSWSTPGGSNPWYMFVYQSQYYYNGIGGFFVRRTYHYSYIYVSTGATAYSPSVTSRSSTVSCTKLVAATSGGGGGGGSGGWAKLTHKLLHGGSGGGSSGSW